MIILKIAIRNLREHPAKTLIVGILIAVGAFLLVAGNSLLSSIESGMHASFSANFTGDLVVHGTGENDFSLLPGPSLEHGLPTIPDFAQVKAQVAQTPGVAATLPMLAGLTSLSVDDNAAGVSFLWAADYADYRRMFPDSLEMVAGDWPRDPVGSILLSQGIWETAQKEAKRPIAIGDKIILTSMGSAGPKIREVTLAGVFKFKRGSDMLDMISLTDPDTLRVLTRAGEGKSSAAGSVGGVQAEPPAAAAIDEDSLFGGDLSSTVAGQSAVVDFDSLLGDTSRRAGAAQSDPDAWHFLLVRLDDPSAQPQMGQAINQWGAGRSAPVVASDWRWAAGEQAQLVSYLQVVFLAIVVVIIVVVVIIIMNTMVISVTERFGEIGTMRAIGARKGFVRQMIMTETLVIAAVFGVIGALLGSLMVAVLGVQGIPASGQLLNLLFGGTALHPAVSASAVISSLVAVAVIGLGSCLYPMSVALRVSPIRAMQR